MSQASDSNLPLAGVVIILLIIVTFVFSGSLVSLLRVPMPERDPVDAFYWGYRGIDILAQAFLVFAATTAVAALFRSGRKGESSKSGKARAEGGGI